MLTTPSSATTPPLCPDSARLLRTRGLTAKDITITGFCTPSGMTSYLENGICTRWGLWDCGIQGAMGCYLAAYISAGNTVKVGDKIDTSRTSAPSKCWPTTRSSPVRRLLLRTTALCCCPPGALSSRLRTLRITTSNPKQSLIQEEPRGSSLWWKLRHDAALRLCLKTSTKWTIFRKED